MKDLFEDMAKSISMLYTEQQELAAIWLERSIMTGEGLACRIAPDCTVKIENNELVTLPEGEQATHKVILCLGTLVSKFQMVLVDLKTNIPLTINL